MVSILDQALTDWELIVCDSYSDDGTWEYFQQFKDDPRVRLYQVPKEGLYAGWNECLRRCRGEYVYIATADDTMVSECLEQMVGSLAEAQSAQRENDYLNLCGSANSAKDSSRPVDICVCNFDVIDERGHVMAGHPAGRWPRKFYGEWMDVPHVRDGRTVFLLHAALGMIWWTMSAVVFRRSLLDRIGLFRTDRGSQADEEWELRAALASDIVYLPEKMATWRVSAQQATANLSVMSRINLDGLESVLRDSKAGVPDEWRQVGRWQEKICHVCRTEYRSSLGLYGNIAKNDPLRFWCGVRKALRLEPGYLLRQCLRGFKWDARMSPDPIAYAHELIERFEANWPPERI